MKFAVTFVAFALSLVGSAGWAQSPQASPGTAVPAPAPAIPPAMPGGAPSVSDSAVVPVPAVRLPGGGAIDPAATNLPTGNDLEWRSGTVELRPGDVVVRTNRSTAPTGVGPRIVKPERKGFGGFLSGFANLFNPFAPVEQGTEVRSEYRYDGQINPVPQPRGLRDERTHEPQTELLSVGLEGQNAKAKRARSKSSTPSP